MPPQNASRIFSAADCLRDSPLAVAVSLLQIFVAEAVVVGIVKGLDGKR